MFFANVKTDNSFTQISNSNSSTDKKLKGNSKMSNTKNSSCITNNQKSNQISRRKKIKRNYNTPEYRHIGINVLYYRRQLGLSQQQLADRADVSRTHLSNIESNNGSTSISMDLLFRLAHALEISPSRLLLMPEDFNR